MGRKKGEIRGLALTLRCVKSNMNCNNNKAGKNLFQEKKVEIVSHKKNIIETTSRIISFHSNHLWISLCIHFYFHWIKPVLCAKINSKILWH